MGDVITRRWMEKVFARIAEDREKTTGLPLNKDPRRCPHDDQICRHGCEGTDCWREMDGS